MNLSHLLPDVRPLRTSPVLRRLLAGRTLSTLGSSMTMVAVMYQMWSATGSTVWTGSVGLAQAVPLVGLGLFAGALVDRGDRRRIYLAATAAQALCSALLAVQGFTGGVPVVVVLALVAAQSGCAAVAGPAASTFFPRLLPKDQVGAALALLQTTMHTMLLVGPALGGLVLGRFGVGGCYLVDAVSYCCGLLGASGLPPMPPMPPRQGPSRPGPGGVLDGLRFLVADRVVRGALVTDLAATVLSMPMSLFPLVNAERFGGDPRTLGLFLSAFSIGGVTASLASGVLTRLARPGLCMLCGAGCWGLALTAFGLLHQPWAGLGCLVVGGAADTLSVVSRSTIVQTATPDALLGRVAAAELIVGQAGPGLGNLRGGLVAGWTSGTTALVSGGVMCVLAVLAVAGTTPQLRAAGVGPPAGETAPAV